MTDYLQSGTKQPTQWKQHLINDSVEMLNGNSSVRMFNAVMYNAHYVTSVQQAWHEQCTYENSVCAKIKKTISGNHNSYVLYIFFSLNNCG